MHTHKHKALEHACNEGTLTHSVCARKPNTPSTRREHRLAKHGRREVCRCGLATLLYPIRPREQGRQRVALHAVMHRHWRDLLSPALHIHIPKHTPTASQQVHEALAEAVAQQQICVSSE